jgi:hypothetical protein
VELEKVALLVELVGMAIEEGKDTLQLRQCVVANLHHGGLVCLQHRHGACRGSRVGADALGGGGGSATGIVFVEGGS